MNLRDQLEAFEGRRYEAYPDPITGGAPWTIGVGHTGPEVHEGLVWNDDQIDAALTMDIENATQECIANFPWFVTMNEPRQAVLVGMVFQMGLDRALKFQRALANMRDEHWANAAEEMRQSQWCRQTPKRVYRLASQMETGEWA